MLSGPYFNLVIIIKNVALGQKLKCKSSKFIEIWLKLSTNFEMSISRADLNQYFGATPFWNLESV